MSGTADRDFILRAAALARSSPQNWSEFLEEVKKYSDRTKDQCIEAPREMLRVAQGRAQACNVLFTILSTCKETAEKIAAQVQTRK